MKKRRVSAAQRTTALRQRDAGVPIPEGTGALGISEATSAVRQMAIAEVQRLRQLGEETQKLKQLVVALALDTVILQEMLNKKSCPPHVRGTLCGRGWGSSRWGNDECVGCFA
jgi:hypothetical protein